MASHCIWLRLSWKWSFCSGNPAPISQMMTAFEQKIPAKASST
jgi:hypothetical protein